MPFHHLLLPSRGFPSLPPALFSASAPSCGSSWVFFPFGGPLTPSSSVMTLAFLGDISAYRVPSLSLWLFPVRFLHLLGFPSVRPPHAPLLGLYRICPCVFLVPLLRNSVESQFLRDGVLPMGRVSSVGGFVPSFSWFRFLSASLWCPFSSVQFSLLPSLGCVGAPLLHRVFLGVSLPLFFVGWRFPSALVLFLLLVSAALSSLGFSQLLSSLVAIFSCSIPIQLQLAYKFPLIYCAFFPFVGGETLVSSLASSLRSSASILQCLFGRCAWRRHLSPMVRCVLGIPSLTRSHIGCYV